MSFRLLKHDKEGMIKTKSAVIFSVKGNKMSCGPCQNVMPTRSKFKA